MKKGIFYRILGLILAVTMLFGLTGFTFLAPAGTSNTIGYTMDEPGQGDQGDQPTEPTEPTEPGQGEQGDQPTEPTEPGQGEQGDQPTEPTEPGQGEQGDQDDQGTPFNPIPAPGPVDARYLLTVVQPEGGVITLAKDSGYTLDDNGTTTVKRAHQKDDGTWETTKLNFTVRAKTADEDSDEDFFKSELYAVYVNGEKVDVTDGKFTYDLANAKGSTITVTAKFYGVKNDPTPSVVGYKADGTDQVAGKWAHHRVVKFETFGFDANSASVVYKGSSDTESLANTNDVVIDNKEMTATINKEVGTDNVEFYFQIEGTVNGTSASTDSFSVTTNKIDKTAPQVKVLQSNGGDFEFGKKSHRSSYQYELSLVNSKSEKAPVSVDWAAKDKNGKNVKDCKSYNEGYNDQKYYYPLGDTFLLSGTTVELKVRQTIECNNIRCEVDKKEGKHWVEYSYIITDEAGNKAIINGGVGEETTGSIPEGNLPYDGNVYWVNGKNNIIADWKAPNLVSNWGIYFCAGKYPVDGQDGTKDIPTDNVGYTKINKDKSTEFTVEKGGSYGLYVDGRGFTLHRYYKYDPQAPEIKNVEFAKGSGLDDFVTELNGGKSILFNKSFVLNVYAIDPEYTNDDGSKVDGTDVSGIVKIEYQLIKASDVKDGKVKSNESWEVGYSSDEESPFGEVCTNEKGDTYYKVSVTKIPFDDSDKFTGYIAFRVTDLAGNETIELYEGSSKNDKGEFEIVDDSILITNEATYTSDSNQPFNVTVFAYDNEGVPYTANDYKGDVWIESATLEVNFDKLTEVDTSDTNTYPENNKQDGDSKVTYTYEYGNPTVNVNWNDNDYQVTENAETGKWIRDLLINDNSYFDGYATITVSYPVKQIGSDDNVIEIFTSTSTATVPIKMQYGVAPATIKVNDCDVGSNYNSKNDSGEDYPTTHNGWFNSNENKLSSLEITAPASGAAAETDWTLTYKENENAWASEVIATTALKNVKGESAGDYSSLKSDSGNCDSIDLLRSDLKEKLFTAPGIYTLTTTTTVTGSRIEGAKSNTTTTVIYYDGDAPEINATFADQEGEERDYNNGKYYNTQRTVTVTLKDYYINDGDIKVYQVDADGNEIIELEKDGRIDSKTFNLSTEEYTYKATYTYGVPAGSENAKDGDNFNIVIEVTDRAGNVSKTDKDGKLTQNNVTDDTTTVYNLITGYDNEGNPIFAGDQKNTNPTFTIDQTKPVVEVSFNDKENSGVKNDKYYDGPRTMTVKVYEHNFNAENATITVAKADSNASNLGDDIKADYEWSDKKLDDSDREYYETTVKFAEECKYSVHIDVTDKAGNTLDTIASTGVTFNGSTAVVPEFVVDQSLPEITFGVSQNQIFGKDVDCTPSFRATDNFLSEDSNTYTYTMTLTRTVREYKGQDVTTEFVSNRTAHTNTELAIAYSNILSDAKNDGIYTLSVRVTDLAGNESTSSVTFTVNRNGSFYEFSDDLAKLVKDYNNGIYAKKANGKYYVTEYNASDLKEGSVKIVITRDGKPIGETIVPTVGTGNIGESGLYEYVYELPNSYFEQDGVYIVEIFSDDAAGNNSKNFVEPNKESIKFVVDSVSPSINMKQGLDQSIVNGSTHTFKALVQDTYSLRSIEIKVDGKVVMRYLNQDAYNKAVENGEKNIALLTGATGEIEYTLNEKTDVQHVEIVATDMSGNVTTTATDDYLTAHESFTPDVLVSTSFWARYIHNTWALIGTGVAVAVIAAAIWFFLKKKNRSEEEAA